MAKKGPKPPRQRRLSVLGDWADIYRELSDGDDRAKAIVAAAYVENNLAMAILARFRLLNDADQKHLYDSEHSALTTFSAKIDIGWALNLYDVAVREDLHRIRKIRNKFAHDLHVRTFDDDSEVRGYCDGLVGIKYLEPLKHKSKPRSRSECYVDLAAHFGERFALDSNSHQRPSRSLNNLTPDY
jgi:hypothetical protein